MKGLVALGLLLVIQSCAGLERRFQDPVAHSPHSADRDDTELKLISTIRKLTKHRDVGSGEALLVDGEVASPHRKAKNRRAHNPFVQLLAEMAADEGRLGDPDDEDDEEPVSIADSNSGHSLTSQSPPLSDSSTGRNEAGGAGDPMDDELNQIKHMKQRSTSVTAPIPATATAAATGGNPPSPVSGASSSSAPADPEHERRHDDFRKLWDKLARENKHKHAQQDPPPSQQLNNDPSETQVLGPRVDNLSRRTDHLSNQVEHLERVQEDFESRVGRHVEWVGQAVQILHEGVSAVESNLTQVELTVSKQRGELSETQTSQQQAQSRIDALEQADKSLGESVHALDQREQNDTDQSLLRLQQSQSQIKQLLERLDGLQTQLQQQSLKLANSRKHTDSLDEKLSDEDERIRTLQALVDSLKQTVDSQSEKLNSVLSADNSNPNPIPPLASSAALHEPLDSSASTGSALPLAEPVSPTPTSLATGTDVVAPTASTGTTNPSLDLSPTPDLTSTAETSASGSGGETSAPVPAALFQLTQAQTHSRAGAGAGAGGAAAGGLRITEMSPEDLPAGLARQLPPSAVYGKGTHAPVRVLVVHRPVSAAEYRRLHDHPTEADAQLHLTPEIIAALQMHANAYHSSSSSSTPSQPTADVVPSSPSAAASSDSISIHHLAPESFRFANVLPGPTLTHSPLNAAPTENILLNVHQTTGSAGPAAPPHPSLSVQRARDLGGGRYLPCDPALPGCNTHYDGSHAPAGSVVGAASSYLPPIIVRVPSDRNSVQIISPGTPEANRILSTILNTTCNVTLPSTTTTINLILPGGVAGPSNTSADTSASTDTSLPAPTPAQPTLVAPVIDDGGGDACCEEQQPSPGKLVMPRIVPKGTLSDTDSECTSLCTPVGHRHHHHHPHPDREDDVIVVDSWPPPGAVAPSTGAGGGPPLNPPSSTTQAASSSTTSASAATADTGVVVPPEATAATAHADTSSTSAAASDVSSSTVSEATGGEGSGADTAGLGLGSTSVEPGAGLEAASSTLLGAGPPDADLSSTLPLLESPDTSSSTAATPEPELDLSSSSIASLAEDMSSTASLLPDASSSTAVEAATDLLSSSTANSVAPGADMSTSLVPEMAVSDSSSTGAAMPGLDELPAPTGGFFKQKQKQTAAQPSTPARVSHSYALSTALPGSLLEQEVALDIEIEPEIPVTSEGLPAPPPPPLTDVLPTPSDSDAVASLSSSLPPPSLDSASLDPLTTSDNPEENSKNWQEELLDQKIAVEQLQRQQPRTGSDSDLELLRAASPQGPAADGFSLPWYNGDVEDQLSLLSTNSNSKRRKLRFRGSVPVRASHPNPDLEQRVHDTSDGPLEHTDWQEVLEFL